MGGNYVTIYSEFNWDATISLHTFLSAIRLGKFGDRMDPYVALADDVLEEGMSYSALRRYIRRSWSMVEDVDRVFATVHGVDTAKLSANECPSPLLLRHGLYRSDWRLYHIEVPSVQIALCRSDLGYQMQLSGNANFVGPVSDRIKYLRWIAREVPMTADDAIRTRVA